MKLMEPISGTSPYITVDEFLDFYDPNLVGQLVNDSQGLTSVSDLEAGDRRLMAALGYASGEVEAAAQRGGRYAVADLQSLAGSNAGFFLRGLIAALAIDRLGSRRGGPELSEQVVRQVKEAREHLKMLAGGDLIFPFAEIVQAGLPEEGRFSEAQLVSEGLITASSFRRSFGNRSGTKHRTFSGFNGPST